MRAIMLTLCVLTLAACSKAPTPPSPPSAPAVPASETLTYECRAPHTSRGTVLRVDDRGVLYLGRDVARLQPTGDVLAFDQVGQTSWTTPRSDGSDSNSFNKVNGQWSVQERGDDGRIFAEASYACRPI